MTSSHISADFPYASNYIDVYGSKMHYIEQGQGNPILFLHGIPASSYLWRNVIPYLSSLGRCIAPDLIGFGKSGKPDIAYTLADHIKYIEKFIEELKLDKITLVMHGFGSLIGIDYAMRHEKKCKGLVFYESYLRSFEEDEIALPYQEQVHSWLDQNDLIMNGTVFVEKVITQGTIRTLTEKEMDHYREPFKQKGSGKPLIQCLRDLPGENSENSTNKLIVENSKKLMKSSLPKLLLYSVPGFITTMATVMWAKDNLPKLEVAEIGEELHYAQESNPELMGETISVWLQGVEQTI